MKYTLTNHSELRNSQKAKEDQFLNQLGSAQPLTRSDVPLLDDEEAEDQGAETVSRASGSPAAPVWVKKAAATSSIVAPVENDKLELLDGPAPKRVLLVDDDLTARLYIRARLMLRGHVQVFEADSAAKGMELLKSQNHWDAALLDIDMGAVNGFELCRSVRKWIRSQKQHQPTIYMVSSRSGAIDKMRAKFAGADRFICKPPQPAEFKELLDRL